MDVLHNSEQRRFEVALAGGGVAELTYTLGPCTLSITHTCVPRAFEGRGIAGRMTQATLDYAHREDLVIIPLCSFAASYLTRQRRRR